MQCNAVLFNQGRNIVFWSGDLFKYQGIKTVLVLLHKWEHLSIQVFNKHYLFNIVGDTIEVLRPNTSI